MFWLSNSCFVESVVLEGLEGCTMLTLERREWFFIIKGWLYFRSRSAWFKYSFLLTWPVVSLPMPLRDGMTEERDFMVYSWVVSSFESWLE